MSYTEFRLEATGSKRKPYDQRPTQMRCDKCHVERPFTRPYTDTWRWFTGANMETQHRCGDCMAIPEIHSEWVIELAGMKASFRKPKAEAQP